ncbi:MAG: hypothetical protein NXI04_28830 [Planctomycetaceae bacterium]|nr:hypothetical protein [Planctomycetaceae bacterium]
MNDHLGIEKMISLEVDESTWKRQLFNSPYGFVECRNDSTEVFVREFDSFAAKNDTSKFIVWLDFANADERHKQLLEFQELVSKMRPGDVAKITMNANYSSRAPRSDFKTKGQYETYLLAELKDDLEDYTPAGGIEKRHLQPAAYARFLADAIRIAATKATESATDITPVALLSCRYSDGPHQMLTVTLVVADESIKTTVDDDIHFREFKFRSHKWDQVHRIDVPHLSLKERRTINSLLGKMELSEIHEKFGFLFAESEADSLKLIESYASHYRRYPGFTPLPAS